jgi:hypothetical protein
MDGVYFLATVVDLLPTDFPPFWGVSFFPTDLLGVYLRILSTVFLASVDSTDFFPAATFADLAAYLEAAFFLPLAPPATLGAAGASSFSVFFLYASFPFSVI